MIKNVNRREVSRDDPVKIRCHLGVTTDDIIDYVRPTARKKPDMIIIHTGTNDMQNKVNTLQKVRKVITTIKEVDVKNEIQIAFSSVIHRDDQGFEEKIKEINRNLCKGIYVRDHTLSMQERGLEGFCVGHEIFQAYIDGT